MDKRKLTDVFANVYKALTPEKISVFFKSNDIVQIRVVSDTFEGKTFSSRFKNLNDSLESEHPEIFNQFLFVFEAYTSKEMAKLQDAQSPSHEINYA